MNAEGWTYLMVFFRLSGLITMMPLFSNAALPRVLRVALAAALTLLLGPLAQPVSPPLLNPPSVLVAVVWEVMVGAAIGYTFLIVVAACGAAGGLMDLQCGLSNASILNPTAVESGGQTLLATFTQTLAAFCLLQADMHLAAIEGLAATFRWSPIGAIGMGHARIASILWGLTMGYFASVLSIVFPVLLSMLCVEVALAFLSRLMPSLNMLTAAAPMRVLIGLFVVALSLPLIMRETQALISFVMSVLGVPGVR